jgi:hypothetical protein
MKLIAWGLVLCVMGCASDIANRYYAAEKYPAKPIDQVQVLYDEPSRPYTVIADFQSRGEDANDMREKAAAIGADAVIVTYLGGTYGNSEEWAEETNKRTMKRYRRITGTAIRYKD